MSSQLKAVVIGGGIAGMSASLLLAQHGRAVTLVEKSPLLAPLIRGFSRQGLNFDTGFHYAGGLHPGGLLDAWLKALGVSVQPLPLNPYGCEIFRFGGNGRPGDLAIAWGRRRWLSGLEEQFPAHGEAIEALAVEMRQALASSPYTNPASQLAEPVFSFAGGVSVQARLDRANLPPRLKTAIGARCLLYGALPHQAAWEDYSMVAGPLLDSAHTMAGGGLGLVAAFEQALSRAGVERLCSVAAQVIEVNGSRAVRSVGLEDGQRLECGVCVYTGHPGRLPELVGPGVFRPAYYKRLRSLEETPSGLMLFAETRSPFLDRRMVCLCPSEEMSDLGNTDALERQFIFLMAGEPDGQGRIPVVAIALLPTNATAPWRETGHRPKAYKEFKADLLVRLAARIETDRPELQGRFRIIDGATDLTMRRWVHGSTGSLFGVRHGLDQVPPIPVTKVAGLLLAGQNIILPGVLGAIVSAAVAVGYTVGHRSVLERFRQCANVS